MVVVLPRQRLGTQQETLVKNRQRLGSLLIAEGLITQEQLEAALSAQRQFRGRIGTNLVELKYVNLDQIAAALSRQLGVPSAGRNDLLTMDSSLVHRLPPRAAKMYRAVPLGPSPFNSKMMRVAMADPGNLLALDEISTILGCRVEPVVLPELRILHLLERLYGIKPARRTFIRVVLDRPLLRRTQTAEDPKPLELSLTPPSMQAARGIGPGAQTGRTARHRSLPPTPRGTEASQRAAVGYPSAPPAPQIPHPRNGAEGNAPRRRAAIPSARPQQSDGEIARQGAAQRAPIPTPNGRESLGIEPFTEGPELETTAATFADRRLNAPTNLQSRREAGAKTTSALPLTGHSRTPTRGSSSAGPPRIRSTRPIDPLLDQQLPLNLEPQSRESFSQRAPPRPLRAPVSTRPRPSTQPLSLPKFIHFPRQQPASEAPLERTLSELAEDDPFELLDSLPDAREPSPVPPAPSDASALAVKIAPGAAYGAQKLLEELQRATHSSSPDDRTVINGPPNPHSSTPALAHTTAGLANARLGVPRSTHPLAATGHSAMSADEALACALGELDAAQRRDQVGRAVVRYLERVFGCGVLLIVKQELALGWLGASPGMHNNAVESLMVPLGVPSMFQAVVESKKTYRGVPPVDGEVVHARFWRALQAPPPREVMVVPVALQSRLVNLVYTHAGPGNALPVMAEEDIAHLVLGVVGSYQRLIRSRQTS